MAGRGQKQAVQGRGGRRTWAFTLREVGALGGGGQRGEGTASSLPWTAVSILCLFACVTVGRFPPSLAPEAPLHTGVMDRFISQHPPGPDPSDPPSEQLQGSSMTPLPSIMGDYL